MSSSPFVRRAARAARRRLAPLAAAPAAPPAAAVSPAVPEPAEELPPAVASSGSVPGSRKVEHPFFDDYPLFLETSETSPYAGRLNLRHEAIFAENRDVFEGRTVLDIASHDARWTLAALRAGATHVIGIEARPELVESAVANLEHYGIDSGRYTFMTGDVYDVMAKEHIDVDVVICLGFFYHTLRYNELMSRIRDCHPQHLIIDTATATVNDSAIIQLKVEDVDEQRNAVADDFSHGAAVLSGKPSIKALSVVAGAYDFELEKMSDWGGIIRDNPPFRHCRDYGRFHRVTARFRAVAQEPPGPDQ